MIETFKDRTRKSFLVAHNESEKSLKALARYRFKGRAFIIRRGYIKDDQLFWERVDGYDYSAKVAYSIKRRIWKDARISESR